MNEWYSDLPPSKDLTPAQAKDLREVMSHPAFKLAVSNILERADGLMRQLAGVDLLAPNGVSKAISIQAEYRTCIKIFDDLITQANPQETTNDNPG